MMHPLLFNRAKSWSKLVFTGGVPALILTGVSIWFFILHHAVAGDAAYRFEALSQWLGQGQMPVTKYSMVGPLFSAPLWLLGRWVMSPEWWCQRFNTVVFGVFLLSMRSIFHPWAKERWVTAWLLALCAGSMFPKHLQGYYGEVFTACLVTAGLALALVRGQSWGWAVVILGVANTPATLGGLSLVALWRAVTTRRLHPMLLPLGPVVLAALDAWIRRGSPWDTGYVHPPWGTGSIMPYAGVVGFDYPWFFGFISIVFSFGKGLVFFAPGLCLPAGRLAPNPALAQWHRAMMLFLLGMVILYSKWYGWHGDWYWGPRYFLFASIPAAASLVWWIQRQDATPTAGVLGLLALALSCWVGLNGAFYVLEDLGLCQENDFKNAFVCWYVPEFGVLWHPFIKAKAMTGAGWVIHAFEVLAWVVLAGPAVARLTRQGLAAAHRARESHAPSQWRW